MKFKVKYRSLLNDTWTEQMEVVLEAGSREDASDRFSSVHAACFGTIQEYEILEIDNFSKLKPIEEPWAYYQIAEDKQYTPYLTRRETDEVLQLFSVTQRHFEVFVLAPDKEGALSQVSCHASWDPSGDADAVRVPFMLRGWSGHIF